MRRILLILSILGLTAAPGCRMCAHPYDECGPTYAGECGPVVCDPYARSGSVLSPPLTPMCAGCDTVVEQSSMPATGGATLEPVPLENEVSTSPQTQTRRVVPPSARMGRVQTGGPTFLR